MTGARHVVVITQRVDPDDVVLGATVAKIGALARRVDEVAVLALSAVDGVLPENCRVRTFGARTQWERGARLGAELARELRPRPSLVLAHMSPIYAVLAAPWCRPLRIPLVLWYTHSHSGSMLRVAERVATAVATVDRGSFPLESRKVTAIGHGIDVSAYPCRDADPSTRTLISLSRYSSVKGLDTIVRAVGMVPGVRLVHHGPELTPADTAYRSRLAQLVRDLGVEDRITLADAVPRSDVAGLLATADALVNNHTGSSDKVVFEAAASCVPVMASSPTFASFLPAELRFDHDDPATLARRIEGLLDLDRRAIGAGLRARVEAEHSVDTWAERILQLAAA